MTVTDVAKKPKGYLGYCILDGKILQKQDSLSIGRFYKEGGCSYEFLIEWEMLGNENVPRLKIFNDAWRGVYEENQVLLKRLSENNGTNLQLDDIIKILKELKYRKKN